MEQPQSFTGERRYMLTRNAGVSGKLGKPAEQSSNNLLHSSSGVRPLSVEEVMNMTRLRPLPMIHIDEKNFFLSDGEGDHDNEERDKEKPKSKVDKKARAKGGAEKAQREVAAKKAKEIQVKEVEKQTKQRPPQRPKWVNNIDYEEEDNTPESVINQLHKNRADYNKKSNKTKDGIVKLFERVEKKVPPPATNSYLTPTATKQHRRRSRRFKLRLKPFSNEGSPRQPFSPVRINKKSTIPVRQSDRYVSSIMQPRKIERKQATELYSSKDAKEHKPSKNTVANAPMRKPLYVPNSPKPPPPQPPQTQPVAKPTVAAKPSVSKKLPLWIPGGISTRRAVMMPKNNSLRRLVSIPAIEFRTKSELQQQHMEGPHKPNKKDASYAAQSGVMNKAGGDFTAGDQNKAKKAANPMRYLSQEATKHKSIFTNSSPELTNDDLVQYSGASLTKLISAKNSENRSIKRELQCVHCDRKFALGNALHLHQIQYCPKIPPRVRRRLQLKPQVHINKAPIPIFSNVKPAKAKTNIPSEHFIATNMQLRQQQDKTTLNKPYIKYFTTMV